MAFQEVLATLSVAGIFALLLDIRHKLGEYGVRLTHLEQRTKKLEENTNVKHHQRATALR